MHWFKGYKDLECTIVVPITIVIHQVCRPLEVMYISIHSYLKNVLSFLLQLIPSLQQWQSLSSSAPCWSTEELQHVDDNSQQYTERQKE